ncbi:MAG: hypothetical protein H7Y11_08810 [Armatimonadetes bacterium]|nr:hypothetical protein [Anaerolineae bacterium]
MAAFSVMRAALRHLNQRGYIYIWANLAAVACALPIVTAPAAWAGLVKLSYNAHLTPSADLGDYWEGFREQLGRGLLLSLLNVVVVGVNVVNLLAYAGDGGLGMHLIRAVWIAALAVWFSVQFYLFPIYYHMHTPTLLGALRNALVMVYLNPLFTLILGGGIGLLMIASSVLFAAWLLLTLSALAVLATAAVLNRLGVALPTDMSGSAVMPHDLESPG